MANVGCFITTAAPQPEGGLNIWSEIRGRELAILFVLIVLAFVGKSVWNRKHFYHGKTRNITEDDREWILF
jgi:hypothetical protein